MTGCDCEAEMLTIQVCSPRPMSVLVCAACPAMSVLGGSAR